MSGERSFGLDHEERRRYARQTILPGIGREGQEKLGHSHVLVAGVGGLGSLSSLYLGRAGVGKLTLVDSGRVQVSDLNRQLLYDERDVGEIKVFAAADRLRQANSDIEVRPVQEEIGEDTFEGLLMDVHVVVDGTDNYRTRLLMNRLCGRKRIPFVYGGVYGLKGAAMTVVPGHTPCLECLLPPKDERPLPVPAVGPIVGQIASIQAMEALKLLLHIGQAPAGELLLLDGGRMEFRKFSVKKRKDCPVCSG
jgi:molybdopterin/thiamine biosynthesis adenylyltransferase